MNRLSSLLLVTIFISCGSTEKEPGKKDPPVQESEISQIKKIYSVPAELMEISGISFASDSILVAIQDEEGILYFYDLATETVTKKYEFWKGKDYEDLTVLGTDIWVISSSGTLYEIKDFKNGPTKAAVYKTGLTTENNIEGLTYDSKNNRLLLAVKDLDIDGNEDQKSIYAFDLKTKQLNPSPVYSIKLSEIESFFKGDGIEEFSKKILKAAGNQNLNKVFRTSALAFHPVSGELYVLSSINNIIAVLNASGVLIKVIELRGKEFTQPEGLAFSNDGRLFISNEGKGKQPNIIELNYED